MKWEEENGGKGEIKKREKKRERERRIPVA